MKIIGLTGSIGMGKSVAAGLFRQAGVPVFDADKCVHELYAGKAIEPIRQAFPKAIVNHHVSREILSSYFFEDANAIKKLEGIIHPLVREERNNFIDRFKNTNTRHLVLDIPLLFETQQSHICDTLCVVTTFPEIQQQRVLSRLGMTVEKFKFILSKQMPDSEKRKRAHMLIYSSSLRKTERAIADLLRAL